MNVPSEGVISLSMLRKLDELCNRFEEQLAAGGQLSVANYLDQEPLSADERQYLFRELIRIQLELLPELRESLRAAWQREFPEYCGIIDECVSTHAARHSKTPILVGESDATTSIESTTAPSSAQVKADRVVHEGKKEPTANRFYSVAETGSSSTDTVTLRRCAEIVARRVTPGSPE